MAFYLLVDIPDKISKIINTERDSSCFPPKKVEPIETRCPAVLLLDCGAFFLKCQDQ